MISRITSPDHHHTFANPISKTWQLYDNPYYCYYYSQPPRHNQPKASICDLDFVNSFMDSELEVARAQILELKAELDYERKVRKRTESINKKLVMDLEDERRGRGTLEMEYKRLFRGSSSEKSEIVQLKRKIEEERKMHRLAEILREERIQMKLADARLFLEEKLSSLEKTNGTEGEGEGKKKTETETIKQSKREDPKTEAIIQNKSRKLVRVLSSPAYLSSDERRNSDVSKAMQQQKRSSPLEVENPHIKRGIKGFVEFPKVMRAIRSKSGQWGSKIESQRAQLKILLRQNTAPRSTSLASGQNHVSS